MSFIPVTIEGRETYVNEDNIDVFGEASIQVGTDEEDGSAVLQTATLVTFASGLQLPIDQTPQEFIAAAAQEVIRA